MTTVKPNGFPELHIFTTAKFPLGKVVITANAASQLDPVAVADALSSHANGDWGIICKEDWEANEEALREGGRLMSAHGSSDERFWIITESDRSVTTVLMPEDY